jgi:hemolysin activation/secretion protein
MALRWIASVMALLLIAARAGGAGAQSVPPTLARQSAPPAVRHFDIEEFRVEGNSVLADEQIETAVYPFLGPDRTADDVEHARSALEALYAQKGYPTVSAEIPEQHVNDEGIIVLKVTERRIGRLRVRGARYFSPAAIRAAAPSLAEGKVPNMNEVQRDIAALNQWPDRTVTPALRPGTAPDTDDVDLDVKDALPLHGSFEINDRKSANTTSLRDSASLSYGNLWQRGDSASVSLQVAPLRPSDTLVWSGSYLLRIPDSDLSLVASYLHSDSDVATIGGTDVIGRGTVIGLRLLIPLGFDAGFSHSLSVGIDYKAFANTVALGADRSNSPVEYYPLTASYQASWTGPKSQTDLTANVVLGTRGFGSDEAEFDVNRYNARPNFAYLRLDASRTQTLPWGMQAYAHLLGQIANEPLISNEQLAAGGLETVRGYLESEALGDLGIIGQTELRSPSLAGSADGMLNDVRVLGFADGATVAIRDALPGQRAQYGLGSAGAGVRVRLFDLIDADLDGAHVLSNGATTRSGATRVLFRVNGAF